MPTRDPGPPYSGTGGAGWASGPFGSGILPEWQKKRFGSSWHCDLNRVPCRPRCCGHRVVTAAGSCGLILRRGLAGTGPLLGMLSQDLFGWGLPGEQIVAALLRPLLMFPEALSQRARWLEWDGGASRIDQAGTGVLCALPDVCVGVAPEQNLSAGGRGSCGRRPRALRGSTGLPVYT